MKNIIAICFGGFFASLMLLTACDWNGDSADNAADISKDTLKYHYANFKQRAADCGDKADTACTSVLITYPVFDNAPTLNNLVLQTLSNRPSINKPADTVLSNYAKDFIDDYEKDASAHMRKVNYFQKKTMSVVRQDSGLVALQIDSYTYSGGAHGMMLTNFINWDTKAQNKITLRDIFQNEVAYKELLDTIGEKIFRKQEHLKPNASLQVNYFFKDYKFSLNNNFLITPTGLKFLYNVYEIKPYAAGQTVVIIPYSQLKPLLKPKTVISQYHF